MIEGTSVGRSEQVETPEQSNQGGSQTFSSETKYDRWADEMEFNAPDVDSEPSKSPSPRTPTTKQKQQSGTSNRRHHDGKPKKHYRTKLPNQTQDGETTKQSSTHLDHQVRNEITNHQIPIPAQIKHSIACKGTPTKELLYSHGNHLYNMAVAKMPILKWVNRIQQHLIQKSDPKEPHQPFCLIMGDAVRRMILDKGELQDIHILSNHPQSIATMHGLNSYLNKTRNGDCQITLLDPKTIVLKIGQFPNNIFIHFCPPTSNLQCFFNYIDYTLNAFALVLTPANNYALYHHKYALKTLLKGHFQQMGPSLVEQIKQTPALILDTYRVVVDLGLNTPQHNENAFLSRMSEQVDFLRRISINELAFALNRALSTKEREATFGLMHQAGLLRSLPYPLGIKDNNHNQQAVNAFLYEAIRKEPSNQSPYRHIALLLLPEIICKLERYYNGTKTIVPDETLNSYIDEIVLEFTRQYNHTPARTNNDSVEGHKVHLRNQVVAFLQEYHQKLKTPFFSLPLHTKMPAAPSCWQTKTVPPVPQPDLSNAQQQNLPTTATFPQSNPTTTPQSQEEPKGSIKTQPNRLNQHSDIQALLAACVQNEKDGFDKLLKANKMVCFALNQLYEQNQQLQRQLFAMGAQQERTANLVQFVGSKVSTDIPEPTNSQDLNTAFSQLTVKEKSNHFNPNATVFNPNGKKN